MSNKKPRVIVVGGGLGGLWATMRIAENNIPVDVFSLFPVRRSHSACAQGGINAVLDTKGQQDTIDQHFIDTIKGGAYLADQPPVRTMCEEAPAVIRAFDRMGVTFSRTPEGILDLRLFGGVKNKRTVFAGATTGAQLLFSCDEQVRHHEEEGRVKKYEWWEFLSVVKDSEGRCRGITAMDLHSLEVRAFPADAVILATGGLSLIYGKSTMSTNSTGAAASRVHQQGADFMNGEFIQFHPTGMLGHDKNRLMSEACRGEGGRIWVPRKAGDNRQPRDIPEKERFYFLEEWYPAYGNTVPRDVGSRAIFKVVYHMKLGLGGEKAVYLDLSHLPRDFLERRLGGILEMYETFAGGDPYSEPMKIFPACHYSMGGLRINYHVDGTSGAMSRRHPDNQMTSILGLYACGECDGAYHGANRLGANSLLSSSFGGMIAGDAAVLYVKSLKRTGDDVCPAELQGERKRQEEINERFLAATGKENPFALYQELGDTMYAKVNVERKNEELDEAIQKIKEIRERFGQAQLDDTGRQTNQSLQWARQIYDMTVLAEVIASCARQRDECRGAHHKPDFDLPIPEGKFPGDPEYDAYVKEWMANNERWLKSTVVSHTDSGPQIRYEKVDTSLLPPTTPRDYR